MGDLTEDDLVKEVKQLEQEFEAEPLKPEIRARANALAEKVFALVASRADQPIEQRRSLVRLAQAKCIAEPLKNHGLLSIEEDPQLGRTIIKLRAFDDLEEVMHRTNDEITFGTKDAPLVRIFR